MEEEVVASLATLEAAMRYDALNFEGPRKILKKFDKRTDCGVSSSVMACLPPQPLPATASTATAALRSTAGGRASPPHRHVPPNRCPHPHPRHLSPRLEWTRTQARAQDESEHAGRMSAGGGSGGGVGGVRSCRGARG